jgi:hypothetical protein
MNLDYSNWDQPDFAQQAVKQVEEGHRLGAAGYKEWKRFGLYLHDGKGELIKIDDPKLDPMWERLGQLHMPISIHVGDPKAFFRALHSGERTLAGIEGPQELVVRRHQQISALEKPAGGPEPRHRPPSGDDVCLRAFRQQRGGVGVGRSGTGPTSQHDGRSGGPHSRKSGGTIRKTVHDFFVKYQDRIFFATDFQSLERLMILGSSGNEAPPSEADAEVFFRKEWRWLETWDKNWAHMTPIQGNWTISSIGLPASVLRKIYFDNARQLLARSLPTRLQARRTARDFVPDADLTKTIWQTTPPVCTWRRSPRRRDSRRIFPRRFVACGRRIIFICLPLSVHGIDRVRSAAAGPQASFGSRRREPVGPGRGGGLHRQRHEQHQALYRI